MIIDIGGGTTEIAIVSLGGIVESRSLRIAGDEFDECIINYMRRTYNLMIGPRTAEDIKMTIGSAYPLGNNELEMEVRGRDQVAGLPITKRINSVEIRECLAEPIQQIIENVKLSKFHYFSKEKKDEKTQHISRFTAWSHLIVFSNRLWA